MLTKMLASVVMAGACLVLRGDFLYWQVTADEVFTMGGTGLGTNGVLEVVAAQKGDERRKEVVPSVVPTGCLDARRSFRAELAAYTAGDGVWWGPAVFAERILGCGYIFTGALAPSLYVTGGELNASPGTQVKALAENPMAIALPEANRR